MDMLLNFLCVFFIKYLLHVYVSGHGPIILDSSAFVQEISISFIICEYN
jgi:hypothetical protein